MPTIVNSGARSWSLPCGKLFPGQSRVLAADEWRLALDLNKALRVAVASGEVQVEEDTSPEDVAAPVAELPPEREEPVTRPMGKRRRGR